MSYVRWSSDGFRSDVYCYEDAGGGFTTHVAGRRRLGLDTLPPEPDLRKLTLENSSAWRSAYKAYHAALDALAFENIDMPNAGRSFNDATFEEMIERLRVLKAEGLYVPDYVFGLAEDDG